MTSKETVIKEIENFPNHLMDELVDFIRFLKLKHIQDKMNISIASESSLSKDWDKPEEDNAWADL